MHFCHLGKYLETIRMENGTHPERSEFIGTYLDKGLIGFKYVGGQRADDGRQMTEGGRRMTGGRRQGEKS
jgi:hypothetical protein